MKLGKALLWIVAAPGSNVISVNMPRHMKARPTTVVIKTFRAFKFESYGGEFIALGSTYCSLYTAFM
jgi:hypothetical protein